MGEAKRRKLQDPLWGNPQREYRWTVVDLRTEVEMAIAAGFSEVVIVASLEQARHLRRICRDQIFKLPILVFVGEDAGLDST